jgi:hypothetical protein
MRVNFRRDILKLDILRKYLIFNAFIIAKNFQINDDFLISFRRSLNFCQIQFKLKALLFNNDLAKLI